MNTSNNHGPKMFKAGKRWLFVLGALILTGSPVISPQLVSAASNTVATQIRRAIDAPVVNPVTSTDTTITGTSVAGYEIELRLPNGDLSRTTVRDDNSFSLPISPQTAGAELTLTAYSPDFESSDPVTVIVEESGQTENAEIQTLNDLDSHATSVTGTATAGSHIVLTVNGSTIGEGDAGDTGAFAITIPVQAGDTVISAVATLGESTSAVKTVTVSEATTTPTVTAPQVNPVTEGDTTITGTANPGNLISALDADGQTIGGPVQAIADGSFIIPVSDLVAGDTLTIQAASGDVKQTTSVDVLEKNSTELATPTIDPLTDLSEKITGTGTDGSIVTATADGDEIGQATVTDGKYSINLTSDKLLNAGTVVSVSATLGEEKSSAATATVSQTVSDTLTIDPVLPDETVVTGTAPVGSIVRVRLRSGSSELGLAVAADGTYTIPTSPLPVGETLVVTATLAGQVTTATQLIKAPEATTTTPSELTATPSAVDGFADPGATVRVTDADGKEIGVGLANGAMNTDGTQRGFHIALSQNAELGDKLTVIATLAGKASDPATVTVTAQVEENTTLENWTNTWSVYGWITGDTQFTEVYVTTSTDPAALPVAAGVLSDNGYIVALPSTLTAGENIYVYASYYDETGLEVRSKVASATVPNSMVLNTTTTSTSVSGLVPTGTVGEEIHLYSLNDLELGQELNVVQLKSDQTFSVALPEGVSLGVDTSYAIVVGTDTAHPTIFIPFNGDPISASLTHGDLNFEGDSGAVPADTVITVQSLQNHNLIRVGRANDDGGYTIPLSNAAKTGDKYLVTFTTPPHPDEEGNESLQQHFATIITVE